MNNDSPGNSRVSPTAHNPLSHSLVLPCDASCCSESLQLAVSLEHATSMGIPMGDDQMAGSTSLTDASAPLIGRRAVGFTFLGFLQMPSG